MWLRRFFWIAPCVLVLGCEMGPSLAPVSGTVTLDGQPLAGATVGFTPEGGSAQSEMKPASTGTTNEKGEYQLVTVLKRQPGAVYGKHRVSVTALAEVPVDQGDAPSKVIGKGAPTTVKDKIPRKYQGDKTELAFEVKSGQNTADFALKSK